MSLSNHVSITITVDSAGVPRAGFGVPMIISHSAAWAERVRSYNNLADVTVDFAVTTSPEYLSAQAMFSQSPRPELIKIGRAALKPTQNYEFTPIAINDHVYSFAVKGEGVTATTVSITADSSATIAEITGLLETAFNAVVGKNFTAVDGVTELAITGDTAADWFSIEMLDMASGKIEQIHADPGIATDLAAIKLEDDAWYCLHTNFNSNAYALAAAAWINAEKKIYVFDVAESDAIKTAVGNSDTLDDIKTSAYSRVAGSYHPAPYAMLSAAWMGRVLPLEPGQETWAYMELVGPAPVTLTATHRTNLVARNANRYETVAAKNITFAGTTADGDFIDVQRGLDWLEDDMAKGVFGVLVAANKIPFTDKGVVVIQAEVEASLQRAENRTIISDDPAFVVTVPKVADVGAADKSARNLPDVKFSATLAGAIHKVTLTGTVSV